ncbi:MAG: hypothetical protein AAGA56_05490 [Myxococcota bacterium]
MRTSYRWWGWAALVAAGACSAVNAPSDTQTQPGTTPSPGSGGGTTTSTDGDTGQGAGDVVTGGGAGGGIPGTCGDGVVDPPEETCDDAGESATCDADCTAVACGDGVQNQTANEGCDDGNTDDDDACAADCSAPTVFDVDAMGSGADALIVNMDPAVAVVRDSNGVEQFAVAYIEGRTSQQGGRVTLQRYDIDGVASGVPVDIGGGEYVGGLSIAGNDAGYVLLTFSDLLNYPFGFLNNAVIDPTGVVTRNTIGGEGGYGVTRMAGGANGGFCRAWATGASGDARVRCYDDRGSFSGTTTTTLSGLDVDEPNDGQWLGSVDIFAHGQGYIVTYLDPLSAVRARAVNAAGVAQGSEFSIVTGAPMEQLVGRGVSVGTRFLPAFVTSDRFGSTVDRYRSRFRVYSAPGTPVDPPTLVAGSHSNEFGVKLVAGPQGDFAAIYSSGNGSFGSDCTLRVQRFDDTFAPLGAPIDVVPNVSGTCNALADGAVSSRGDLFITWLRVRGSGAAARITQGILWPDFFAVQ